MFPCTAPCSFSILRPSRWARMSGSTVFASCPPANRSRLDAMFILVPPSISSAGKELKSATSVASRVGCPSFRPDDYVGGFLTNPTIPARFTNVHRSKVILREHVIVGCGSVILPGVVLERGAAVGALSLVTRSVPEYHVVLGNPARAIKKRNADRLNALEREFLDSPES